MRRKFFVRMLVCDPMHGDRDECLVEYDGADGEGVAWRDAMAAAEERGYGLWQVMLYDTRLGHRAVYHADRYRDDGTLIAPAGWYNARSPYVPAGGSWTAVEEV